MTVGTNIYQQIWSADSNAATVISVDPDTGQVPASVSAHVILDEQVQSSGKREIDLATRPLFRHVDPDLLRRPTYAALIQLLDNYVVSYRAVEMSSPEEEREIDELIALIDKTDPMSLAYDYIKSRLRRGISRDTFRGELRRMWFQTYTNHFQGRSTHHCSGFEHVFVGEGKYNIRHGATEAKGEITGYHSWVKFHLDEASGRVDFLGHKYDLQGGDGPDNPRVVTLQMLWTHRDFEGQLVAQLFKKKGGFFVGTSPEAELAMGTVAFYESVAGLVNDDRIRARLGGEERLFDLVIYRNVLPDGRRGDFIRSFFPVYLGDGAEPPMAGRTRIRPVDPELRNPGPILIAQALPNPPDPRDQTGEWVALRNSGARSIDLGGWELRDRMQRPLRLSGALAPGEQRRFDAVRRANGFELGNKRGLITLHDQTGELRAAVAYTRADEGQIITFTS